MEKEKLSNSDLMSELENRLQKTLTTKNAIDFLKRKIEYDELSDDEITEIYEIIESDCDEIQSLKDEVTEAETTDISDFSTSELIEALNKMDKVTAKELSELDDDIIEILLEMLAKNLDNKQLRELICKKFKMPPKFSHEPFASDFFREFSANIYSFD